MKQTSPLWLTLILVVLFSGVGFYVGKVNKQSAQITQIKQEISEAGMVFSSKTAEIQGKITSIEGDMTMIQSASGGSAKFKLGQQIYITKYDSKNKPSYSTKREDLELNKDAIINLTLPKSMVAMANTESKYELTAITFLPGTK